MKYIKKTFDNYELSLLHTDKFKTIRMRVTFTNDLKEDTITERALLPYLMKSVSKTYPTRKEFTAKLETMYSASLGVGVEKKGLSHILTFDLNLISNNYTLDGEDLLTEGLTFLNEVITNPLFDETVLQEEKRLLKEYHQGVYANKMRFALKETLDYMYEGEIYNTSALGYEDKIDEITLEDMKNAYFSMLNEDVCNISVVGDIEVEEITTKINQTLQLNNPKKELILLDKTPKKERKTESVDSIQDVSQAKVVIGYQFPVYYQSEDYYKAAVLNSLLGGNAESLLFKRIREELSLVYFIGSIYDNYKGTILVYGGISKEEKQHVEKEVDLIIESIIQKSFDPKALDIAKKTIVSAFIESYDSSGSLIKRINDLSLFNREFNKDRIIAAVNNTTIEDLSRLAKQLTKEVVYCLRNDHNE